MQAHHLTTGATITALYTVGRNTVKRFFTLHYIDNTWYIQNTKTGHVDHISILKEALLFLTNDLPFKIDTDFNTFESNGNINIVHPYPVATTIWIIKNNFNPHFTQWHLLRFCTQEKPDLDTWFKPPRPLPVDVPEIKQPLLSAYCYLKQAA